MILMIFWPWLIYSGLLFHRVILMSGSALSPWARATNPHNTSKVNNEKKDLRVNGGYGYGTDNILKTLHQPPQHQKGAWFTTMSEKMQILREKGQRQWLWNSFSLDWCNLKTVQGLLLSHHILMSAQGLALYNIYYHIQGVPPKSCL